MARKLALTWHNPRRCWKKYHKGKTLYLGKGQCKGKSDMVGYQIALEEYKQLHPLTSNVGIGDKPNIVKIAMYSLARRLMKEQQRLDATPTATQIQALANEFIAAERRRCQSGQTTLQTVWECEKNVQEFVKHARMMGKVHANEIDAQVMGMYQTLTLAAAEGRTGEPISLHTIKKRLRWAKRFVLWLDENEHIERCPRNVGPRYAHVTLPKPMPKHFTASEVRSIFGAASRRAKLYILLALNGGFTQTDIASLRHEHIDWETGVIRRRRQKTEKKSGVEQVFKMWPLTKQLLREEMTPDEDGLVLLDEDGNKLVRVEEDEKGKPHPTDAVRSAFNRAMVACGMDRKTEEGNWVRDERRFKVFRKTGANEIAKLYPHVPGLDSLYLAHQRAGAINHYTNPNRTILDEAIAKLEHVFALRVNDAGQDPA